jgi:uncharacterized DUF497 family protein
MEWAGTWIERDMRKDYGKPRYFAIGMVVGRLDVVASPPRAGNLQVISSRKAIQNA